MNVDLAAEREASRARRDEEWVSHRAKLILDDIRVSRRSITPLRLQQAAEERWKAKTPGERDEIVRRALEISGQESAGALIASSSKTEKPGPEGEHEPEPETAHERQPTPEPPADDGLRTPKDLAVQRLRENPDVDYKVVLREVQRRFGWDGTPASFARGPWRLAKMVERKERTGSAWTKKEERPPQKPRKDERKAPRPRPEVAPVRDGAAPVIDYRTTNGSLSVRREGGGHKLIFSCRLDTKSIDHLLPLLTAVMQAGVLRGRA